MENKRKMLLEVDPADVQDVIWSMDELMYSMKHLVDVSGEYENTEDQDQVSLIDEICDVGDALEHFAEQADTFQEYCGDCENEILCDELSGKLTQLTDTLFDLSEDMEELQDLMQEYATNLRAFEDWGEYSGEGDAYLVE